MILKKKYLVFVATLVVAISFSGCTGGYEPVPNMVKLDAKLTDSKWDGKKIPKDQVCSLFTKTAGSTPSLTISNIPKGTNAIIVEINDEGYMPLSNNGGHGKVGFFIEKSSSTVTLPAVPGEIYENLPKDTFIESASRSKGKYATRGYLPPCSGGRNHMYSAEIKAVYKAQKDDEKSLLLGETYIQFGRY